MKCLRCEVQDDTVKMRCSYTAYHWDGTGEDPNRDIPLCDVCFEEHYEYWREMWSYANGGYGW